MACALTYGSLYYVVQAPEHGGAEHDGAEHGGAEHASNEPGTLEEYYVVWLQALGADARETAGVDEVVGASSAECDDARAYRSLYTCFHGFFERCVRGEFVDEERLLTFSRGVPL